MGARIETQVAIVGGGPVGLGLALDLGLKGVSCVVIERAAQMHKVPKGQNLTQRTLEHFHFWGAESALREARTIPPEFGIGGLTAYGSLLSGYNYDWLQRDLVRRFYYTANERLPQYATETVLRSRASEVPAIRPLFGFNADEISERADTVTVRTSNRDTGQEAEIEARYLVGCDGSRSMVRTAVGITETRSDHDRMMVLLVFDSPQLDQLLQERFPGKSYFNVLHPALNGYWQFFGRVDLAGRFFFHAPVPVGTTAENFDFKSYLHEAVGAPFDLQLDYVGFWDLRIALADTYRRGRILIAGDAAHSHPPYGGYGINTGLEDVVNLGWKLAAVLQGWAGSKLLNSYDEERRPVFQSTARDFIERAIQDDRDFLAAFAPSRDRDAFEAGWAARQTGAKSEVDAFEPNYEGSPIVCGPPGVSSALGSHQLRARPGHHLAPMALADGGNVYDLLGNGFTLIVLGAPHGAREAFEAAARARGIPLQVIEADDQAAAEAYQVRLILVRPDQFVAWVGADAAGAEAVLDRSIGAEQDRGRTATADTDNCAQVR